MITVRPELPGDEDAIRQVNLLAFGRENEGNLVDLIRGSRFYVSGLSLVAVVDGKIVGHLLMSAAMLVNCHDAMSVLTLAPMAVIPEYQSRGIGTQMVVYALESAESTGFPAVVVHGDCNYYKRFGFVKATDKGIYAPVAVSEESYMVLELNSRALANITGTVRYPPCFADI